MLYLVLTACYPAFDAAAGGTQGAAAAGKSWDCHQHVSAGNDSDINCLYCDNAELRYGSCTSHASQSSPLGCSTGKC